MANTTTSPNMNLTIPVVGVDPGPQYALDLNTCLSLIDSHDHTPGKGVPIQSSSINITTNLPFNNNSATGLTSTVYTSQGSALTTPQSVYVVGANLFYTNSSGQSIQITQGTGLATTAGLTQDLTTTAPVTVQFGYTLFYPHMILASGATYTINGTFDSIGPVTIMGILTITGHAYIV